MAFERSNEKSVFFRPRWAALCALLLGLTQLACVDAEAEEIKAVESANVRLLDLEVRRHDHETVRFVTDVIQDRIVVMNFIYTNCTTSCPLSSAIMGKVRRELGERVGADVRLVSLSVDPATDTPARLNDYSRRFGAGPGWIWLTGERLTVNRILKGLGIYTADFQDHPLVWLIGDGRVNTWTRLYGVVAPSQIIGVVESFTAARAETKAVATVGQ